MNIENDIVVDPEVEEALVAHDWPGNVREMENVVDRALILAEEGRISFSDLPSHFARVVPPGPSSQVIPTQGGSLRDQVRRFEGSLICKAIKDAGGDRRLAAQNLGMGLSSLYRKLEEYEALGLLEDATETRHEHRAA